MPSITCETSALLLVDYQSRLMPVIEGAAAVLENARRLVDAAQLLGVPLLFTEQNAKGLGPTVPELHAGAADTAYKMAFDARRHRGFLDRLPARRDIVVCGCETHVCVLQTVFGLLRAGRQVFLARDAVGSRRAESKETAIAHGKERRRGGHHRDGPVRVARQGRRSAIARDTRARQIARPA